MIALLTLFLLSLAQTPQPAPQAPAPPTALLRARYLITVTDDFIVEVYLNGKAIPNAKRTMLEERFGATVERIDVPVRKGDWLVFNVVNNRLRWGGAYYFAVAGCFARDEFGFVSQRETGDWSACDTPDDVEQFITDRAYFEDHPAQEVTRPWGDGAGLMRQFAGNAWNGEPLWGNARNTWIKVLVE